MKKDIFVTGKKYLAKKNFENAISKYVKGEILIFNQSKYSPYDDCFVYEFNNLSGDKKIWISPAESSNNDWEEFFRICN